MQLIRFRIGCGRDRRSVPVDRVARMIRHGRNDDETVRLTAQNLGMAEDEVRLMLAIVRGESDGDVIEIKPRRKERTRRSQQELGLPTKTRRGPRR